MFSTTKEGSAKTFRSVSLCDFVHIYTFSIAVLCRWLGSVTGFLYPSLFLHDFKFIILPFPFYIKKLVIKNGPYCCSMDQEIIIFKKMYVWLTACRSEGGKFSKKAAVSTGSSGLAVIAAWRCCSWRCWANTSSWIDGGKAARNSGFTTVTAAGSLSPAATYRRHKHC